MSITTSDLSEVIESAWSGLCGDQPTSPAVTTGLPADSLSVGIEFHGNWSGKLTLSCEEVFAGQIAAMMFAISHNEVDAHQAQDALLEFANIVGGSLAPLLAEGVDLSIPTMRSSSDPELGSVVAETTWGIDNPTILARLIRGENQ